MEHVERVFGGSSSRPGKVKGVIGIVASLMLVGLLGSPAGAAGQMQGQDTIPSRGTPRQNRLPRINPTRFPKPSRKQQQALLDNNFKQMKKHADDLAELAKSLQKEIHDSNANVLSLEIVKKAEQVEKLAKKIKKEAKAY